VNCETELRERGFVDLFINFNKSAPTGPPMQWVNSRGKSTKIGKEGLGGARRG
jgi:hypothetical protein